MANDSISLAHSIGVRDLEGFVYQVLLLFVILVLGGILVWLEKGITMGARLSSSSSVGPLRWIGQEVVTCVVEWDEGQGPA
jgi:hypothetical protein